MATEDGKSDDGEDVELAERTSHIAYGEAEAGEGAARAAIEAGIEAGNIALQAPDAKMELSEASRKVRAAQEARLAEMELARRMKALAVPTDDTRVREMLRSLQQPVTLFAERQMERRERLRRLLAEKQAAGEQVPLAVGEMEVEEEVVVRPTEKFYTPGGPGLRPARCTMALWSLARARTRIAIAKRRRDDTTKGEEREAWLRRAKVTGNECSEFADSRPIQGVALSQCGTWLATASWSGQVKLWALEGTQCKAHTTIRAHDERCTGVDWRPQAASFADEEEGPCSSSSSSSLSLATASADGTARLWAGSGKLLRVLQGHEQRLARCRFHPMGCFLGTASFDGSWRLWDLQAGQSLSVHEGHSRAAYALAFHPDGSLAVSGGLDSIARVWDCRSGRSVITLQGHVRGVLATDFSPNGYVVATGSEDNTCRIWDLRRKCCVYTIPSHRKLVTQVRFEPHSGHFLATASHDRTVRLWSARDWKLQCTLAGHEEKVMDMAVDPQGTGLVASVSYDRVLKLWAPSEDHALLQLGPSAAKLDAQDALPLSDTAAAADMDTEQPLPPPPGPPPTSASAADDG